MTIHVSVRALLFVLYTAAVLAGAFGISYAVFEWRDDDVNSRAFLQCWEDAWDEYVSNDKESPDSPGRLASDKAWDDYYMQSQAVRANNRLNWDNYTERVKECFP